MTAARRAGVPQLWIEDAAQDIALACWLSGDDGPIVVRRRAIDAARRYGGFNRTFHRPEIAALDDAVAVPAVDCYARIDRLIDFQRAWDRLSAARQRWLIAAAGRAAHMSDTRTLRYRAELRATA